MRDVLSVKRDCTEFAGVFATVCKTAAASLCDFVSAHRALVASNVDDFDDVGIFLISAHCKFDALCQNCAFFVNATTHGWDFARHDTFGNVDRGLSESVRPRFPCDFAKHFIFEMLNFCVENSHIYTYLFQFVCRVELYTIFDINQRYFAHFVQILQNFLILFAKFAGFCVLCAFSESVFYQKYATFTRLPIFVKHSLSSFTRFILMLKFIGKSGF